MPMSDQVVMSMGRITSKGSWEKRVILASVQGVAAIQIIIHCFQLRLNLIPKIAMASMAAIIMVVMAIAGGSLHSGMVCFRNNQSTNAPVQVKELLISISRRCFPVTLIAPVPIVAPCVFGVAVYAR